MNSYDKQRSRLKQEPIDNWSTREKLALATAVQKIGNQNWGPIVRQLKLFSEKNRPADWFSSKFCALQYNDMFDKIEAPKRKRGERGEETTQELIVKKYSVERLEEIQENLKNGSEKFKKLNDKIKILKSEKFDKEFLKEAVEDIRKNEQKKKNEEIALQKSLAEREIKLSQMSMKFRGHLTPKQQPIKVEPAFKENQEKIQKESNNIVEKEKEKVVEDDVSSNTNKTNETISVETPSINETQSPKIQSIETEIKTDEIIEHKTDERTPSEVPETVVETSEEKVAEVIAEEQQPPPPPQETKKDNDKIEITSEAITLEITNDESCETNETVFDEPISNDNPEENDNQINENENLNIKSEIDIKVDPSDEDNEESQMISLDNTKHEPNIVNETDNNISFENNEEPNPNNQNKKVISRKRKQPDANSRNISTRSTRSQVSMQQEKEEAVTIKEEIKSAKKRLIVEEKFNPSYSEDSNESKTNILDTPSRFDKEVDVKWKKAALIIIRNLQNHRSASLLMNSNKEEFKDIIRRKIDLNTIKKRLENEQIRSNDELKVDLMLLFLNNIVIISDQTQKKFLMDLYQDTSNLLDKKEKETKNKTKEKSEVRKSLGRPSRRSMSNEIENTPRRVSTKKAM